MVQHPNGEWFALAIEHEEASVRDLLRFRANERAYAGGFRGPDTGYARRMKDFTAQLAQARHVLAWLLTQANAAALAEVK